MMTAADLRCLFVILIKMFAVGVRRALFPSTREADSYGGEEETRRPLGKDSRLTLISVKG